MIQKFFSTCIIFLFASIISCRKTLPLLPDLREKYSYTDTKPFGTFAAHAIVEKVYADNYILKSNSSFEEKFAAMKDTGTLYFCISRNYLLRERDVFTMLDYVLRGNTAFISASYIDTLFLGKMNCTQANYDWLYRMGNTSYRKTSVRLIEAATNPTDSFTYFYYPFANYFSSISNPGCRIIGYNDNGDPNFLVFFWGKGRIYLHSDPRAFSNYFLLTDENYKYFQQVLQLMPQKPVQVYWDNYYNGISLKPAAKKKFTGLNAIFDQPALSTAFWISISLLGLYLIFNSKRRQRIIPVIKPLENTTIAFAQVIAGLYLQEKNNKNIADKMVMYFNEHIRSRYLLNTNSINADFIAALSRKSGVTRDKTESLYNFIHLINTSDEINDNQLLSLNEQIQEFHKNKT